MKTQIASPAPKQPVIAIVYDRANTEYGGAEYLLGLVRQAFPHAPLYTSVCNTKVSWTKQWSLRTSFLQHCRLARRYHQLFVGLMPLAFETLDLAGFDVVLSFTSAEAKGVITLPQQRHISYIFTPPRYMYESTEYTAEQRWLSLPVVRHLFGLVQSYLRWWDQQAAWRPDVVLTLSNRGANKIMRAYGRASQVIYPACKPADQAQDPSFEQEIEDLDYVLSISRLVSYKKVDVVIAACMASQRVCLVVGTGVEQQRLIRLADQQAFVRKHGQSCAEAIRVGVQASKSIVFLNSISESERQVLMRKAKVVCMLGNEDFGMVAVESLVAQTPVVLSKHSGAAELVKTIPAAVLVGDTAVATVSAAIGRAYQQKVSSQQAKTLAEQCSPKVFIQQLRSIVYDSLT